MKRAISGACALLLGCAAMAQSNDGPPGGEAATATYSVETTLRLMTDRRSRGISDSDRHPAAELHVEAAHASGLVGVFELGTVSSHVYPGSKGYNALVAGGYRWGNPDAWHFGVGLAHERFPGAHFEAPGAVGFDVDPATGEPFLVPLAVRDHDFTTTYGVFEFAWGPVEARYLHVLSKEFRGFSTGMVCGTLLTLRTDPTSGLDCFARGDHGSRGTQLLDVDFNPKLDGRTTLLLHAGLQKVKNFSEADTWDWRAGVKHSRWGFDWSLEVVGAHVKAAELYVATDDPTRRLDKTGVVFTIAKTF